MKCLKCHNNETDSTSGLCWLCLSNAELVRREESSTKVTPYFKIESLLEDVRKGKFGTKNRAELLLRLEELTK